LREVNAGPARRAQDRLVTELDTLLRLAIGTAIPFVMGLERSRRMQFVGARTFGIIGLAGAAAAVAALQLAAADAGAISPVLQGVLAGVGFVGAGVILHPACRHSIQGVTTAAAMWLAAIIGFEAGMGAWALVVATGALALVLLIVPEPLRRAKQSPASAAACAPPQPAAATVDEAPARPT
jgi:putative Mg2+ transporter-C (MgtC) family protein